MNEDQYTKAKSGAGFIAALDQSGGSTPKALKLYGIAEDSYSGDEAMFDLVHQMRARIITSPAFDGDRIMGAILFEDTMDRTDRGPPDRGLSVEREARRAVPQGGQGSGRRGGRCAGDEADPRASTTCWRGPATTACSARRCARSSSSLARAWTRSSRSSSRSAGRSWPPGWCRSSSPRSTSTARARPKPRTSSRRPCSTASTRCPTIRR